MNGNLERNSDGNYKFVIGTITAIPEEEGEKNTVEALKEHISSIAMKFAESKTSWKASMGGNHSKNRKIINKYFEEIRDYCQSLGLEVFLIHSRPFITIVIGKVYE